MRGYWYSIDRSVGLRRSQRAVALAAVVALVAGCGKPATESVHIRGTVTYRGQPVPRGIVAINPDRQKGNHGERGYAAIVDGAFDTSANGGVAAPVGAVKFAVGGYDGQSRGEVSPDGAPLFDTYQMAADVNAEQTEFEIVVP